MTQEELDALMNEGLDDIAKEETDDTKSDTGHNDNDGSGHENFKVDSASSWPPPPPDDDHKVVHQLDDVTKESEEKATEIFDIIENISNVLMEQESSLDICDKTLQHNISIFGAMAEKFPDIKTFKQAKTDNEAALEKSKEVLGALQESGDNLMHVMDIMQYQDIHRQKIERVINVMRALSNYMNALFAGKIDDDKRVSSAVHIAGDTQTEDVVNADDIEALLAQFGSNG